MCWPRQDAQRGRADAFRLRASLRDGHFAETLGEARSTGDEARYTHSRSFSEIRLDPSGSESISLKCRQRALHEVIGCFSLILAPKP